MRQGLDFFHTFLDVVFAEIALSRCMGLGDRLGGKSFGDGQKAHRGGIPPGGFASLRHAQPDRLQIGFNFQHNLR